MTLNSHCQFGHNENKCKASAAKECPECHAVFCVEHFSNDPRASKCGWCYEEDRVVIVPGRPQLGAAKIPGLEKKHEAD